MVAVWQAQNECWNRERGWSIFKEYGKEEVTKYWHEKLQYNQIVDDMEEQPQLNTDPNLDPKTDDAIEPNYDRWTDSDDFLTDTASQDLDDEIGDAEERPKQYEIW